VEFVSRCGVVLGMSDGAASTSCDDCTDNNDNAWLQAAEASPAKA
jgi:predicted nucleic acid-binding protein